jgi:hypothetical protein
MKICRDIHGSTGKEESQSSPDASPTNPFGVAQRAAERDAFEKNEGPLSTAPPMKSRGKRRLVRYLTRGTKVVVGSRYKLYAKGDDTLRKEAKKLSAAFVDTLQCAVESSKGSRTGGAVFPDDLVELSQSAHVRDWLRHVASELRSGRPINLWTSALEANQGNRKEALRWMAGLFFDNSVEMKPPAATAYLEDLAARTPQLATPQVREVADLLAEIIPQTQAGNTVGLYPPELPGMSSRALYHYYVIALAAERVAERYPAQRELAAFVGFVFNTTYEYFFNPGMLPGVEKVPFGFSTGETANLIDAKSIAYMARQLFKPTDPASFDKNDPVKRAHLSDMYSGYLAALTVTGNTATAMSFDTFADVFSSDNETALVQQWMKTGVR